MGCESIGSEQDQRDLVAKLQEVRDHMHARFAASRRIEMAIAFGDLDRARSEAQAIATVDEPAARAEWQPYIQNVRSAAEQITQATDTPAAARASAQLGRRCAECHAAARANIKFARELPPPSSSRLTTQMAMHQWAAGRLWEGLIGPSPTLWMQGARGLADMRWPIVAEGDVPPEIGVADDVQRLHLHARRAVDAVTLDERATAYGEILATCAGCHRAIRD